MSLDGLKEVLDQASVGGAAPIKLPFDQIQATCGLNLDSDDNKIVVGQWAEQNGYDGRCREPGSGVRSKGLI